MASFVEQALWDSQKLILQVAQQQEFVVKIKQGVELLTAVFQQGGKVLVAGNGGSACDAMHFAEEFTGKFRQDRRPLPVIALKDPAHLTAVGNDYGFGEIFGRGVLAYGQKGDLFLGITTSGNSANIEQGIVRARELQIKSMGLLGRDGGRTKGLSDWELLVPGQTSDRIQELQMTILHIMIEGVERNMFPENY